MAAKLLSVRRLSVAALAACACLTASAATANSTANTATRANKMAYDMAIKCFIVDGYAVGEHKKAGDNAIAGRYEAMARESFNVAFNAGAKLGFSDDHVQRDIDFTQGIELPRLIRDQKYLTETAATCKAVGLM